LVNFCFDLSLFVPIPPDGNRKVNLSVMGKKNVSD
jgi:hypothetical protein